LIADSSDRADHSDCSAAMPAPIAEVRINPLVSSEESE
jgi:hypothetical protein